jgi:hypothetical protein
MNVKESVEGNAVGGDSDFARKYIINRESDPETRGRIRKSLSGFSNG